MPKTLLSAFLICLFTHQILLAQENNIIATVDGTDITQADVDYLIAGKILPLQKQIDTIRKIALENFITNLLLKKEAKKRGVSVRRLKQSLTSENVSVSPEEIENAFLENREAFNLMNSEEARERLRLDLVNHGKMRIYRRAIDQLKQEAKIIYYQKTLPTKLRTDERGPVLGMKDARITIVEFSDFLCPHCRNSQKVLGQLLKKYGSDIKIIFKHLPLQPNSQILALAAVCADKQGRFWEYHDELFKINTHSGKTPLQIVTKLKLNVAEFEGCMKQKESITPIVRDLNEAKRLGINSTPSFIVNGELIRGAPDLETFVQIIESQNAPRLEK